MEITYSIQNVNNRYRYRHGHSGCEKSIRNLKAGESATVIRIKGQGALRKRLMEMGITKGAEIRVRKIAPLGDPIQITVRGYELSIRKDEAENIIIV